MHGGHTILCVCSSQFQVHTIRGPSLHLLPCVAHCRHKHTCVACIHYSMFSIFRPHLVLPCTCCNVQHTPVLSAVDVLAIIHGVNLLTQLSSISQLQQQLHNNTDDRTENAFVATLSNADQQIRSAVQPCGVTWLYLMASPTQGGVQAWCSQHAVLVHCRSSMPQLGQFSHAEMYKESQQL